jgi:hypothetical protein
MAGTNLAMTARMSQNQKPLAYISSTRRSDLQPQQQIMTFSLVACSSSLSTESWWIGVPEITFVAQVLISSLILAYVRPARARMQLGRDLSLVCAYPAGPYQLVMLLSSK